MDKEKIKTIVGEYLDKLHQGDIAGNKYSEDLVGPLVDMLAEKYDLPEDNGSDESEKLYNDINLIVSRAEAIATNIFPVAFAEVFLRIEEMVLKDVPRR